MTEKTHEERFIELFNDFGFNLTEQSDHYYDVPVDAAPSHYVGFDFTRKGKFSGIYT